MSTKQTIWAGLRHHPQFEAFTKFHLENPQVFRFLSVKALQRKRAGFAKAGIRNLIEAARWDFAISTRGEDGFKINNSVNSCYARALMLAIPELGLEFFDLRDR